MQRNTIKIALLLSVIVLLFSVFGVAGVGAQDWCARRHYVSAGENLSGIARWYGTTTAELQRLNGITNINRIYRGTYLCVRAATYTPPPPPPPAGNYYVVQPGDTLARISLRFGVDMWSIARANNILNLNRIYSGQYLLIPR